MRHKLVFLTIAFLKSINCNESESFEVRHLDIKPYYETIIFSDVMDIIKELNKNFNSPFSITNSESNENVDDLLSEYQHYLEKAHEQRRAYSGKLNQTRHKMPYLRRGTFDQSHFPTSTKNNNYYNPTSYYNPIFRMPPTAFHSPLDSFVPEHPSGGEYFSTYSQNLGEGTDVQNIEEVEYPSFYKKALTSPPLLQKPFGKRTKPSCFCAQLPCRCACKQCFVQFSQANPNNYVMNPKYSEMNRKIHGKNSLFEPRIHEYSLDDKSNTGNTLNVKIKVDVQLPRNVDDLVTLKNKQYNRESALEYEDMSSKIRLPKTSFNFPIPLDTFAYKTSKINTYEPQRKITVHKKKSRTNGHNINTKRHRKKVITLPYVNVSTPQTTISLDENYNTSVTNNPDELLNETPHVNGIEREKTTNMESTNYTTTTIMTDLPTSMNTIQFENSIYFMVNISNNSNTEDNTHKSGNSIELEFTTKAKDAPILRKKREVNAENNNDKTKHTSDTITQRDKIVSGIMTLPSNIKKLDKALLSDSELLYWPSSAHNVTVSNVRNITNMIIEKEITKAKLNMSQEAISRNSTAALEKAVFGKVDWNDIDTVVPTFISFVGKYMNGMLTFCSSQMCHSIKCAEKNCIHRTCRTEDRFNQIGHCFGSYKTDSVVSMVSLMDMPSNVAHETVNILQDKMLGKLYGKATFCISSKCISIVTCKKTFKKFKCAAKTLNSIGHCPGSYKK